MSKTYISWPENDEPADFSQIADPIVKAIKFAYKIKRKNENKDIPWHGLNIGKSERATCPGPFDGLSMENLKWSLEDQGREAIEELVGLAVQLGIEQGRRIEKCDLRKRLSYRKDFENMIKEILMT